MREASGSLALDYYMTSTRALPRADLHDCDPTAKPPDDFVNGRDLLLAVAVNLNLVDQVLAESPHDPHDVFPN